MKIFGALTTLFIFVVSVALFFSGSIDKAIYFMLMYIALDEEV